MKRFPVRVWPYAAALLAGACNVAELLKPDPDALALAQQAYGELAAGQTEQLVAQLPKVLDTPDTRRTLSALHNLIPAGEAGAAQVIGSNKFTGTGGDRAGMTIRYRYGARCLVQGATVVRERAGQPWKLIGLQLYVCSPEFEKAPAMFEASPPPPRLEPAPLSTAAPA